MDISKLTNPQLTDRLKRLVQTERKITHLVLECIAEIDRRKLYADRAFSSLYEFLVKDYGYSPSAAIPRIESARLLREIPDLAQKIESGSLNLSQLSKTQQALRTAQKTRAAKIPVAEKRTLLKKIENTNQIETELILSKELDLPFSKSEKTSFHQDHSVTISVSFDKAQFELLKQVRDVSCHAVPTGNWADLIVYLAKKELQRRSPGKEHPPRPSDPNEGQRLAASDQETAVSPVLTAPSKTGQAPARKSLSRALKKRLLQNAQCQYVDPETSKPCASRFRLEIDHIKPIWAGGDHRLENLQVLCRTHNLRRYSRQSGIKDSPPP